MANEMEKDFNKMLRNDKDMPKIVELNDEATAKWGGRTMIVAPPRFYDEVMKKVPKGKLITTDLIRKKIAFANNCDITCPLTAGMFINIVAWASYQRMNNITPYWRCLKTNGELNSKYPEAYEFQKRLLEEEGHTIITKGKKNIRYFVKDYEESLVDLYE